jgi:hypothetical protein
MSEDRTVEEREVRVEDPRLSESANARLTDEVREVLGTDHVEVPRDRPHPSLGEEVPHASTGAVFVEHRAVLIVLFCFLITFGAILSLITHDWWFLPLAAVAHAAGTMIVLVTALRFTTSRERPHPTTVALLESEGITDPEGHFSDLVSEFSDGDRRGGNDLLAADASERTVSSQQDPVRASAEQQTAMTPTAMPSKAVDSGSLPWVIAATLISGVVIASLVLAIALGGAYWFAPAILVPSGVLWLVMRRLTAPVDDPALEQARRRWVPWVFMIGTVVLVGIFCLLVALFITSHDPATVALIPSVSRGI